jgi:hypothetical protein
MKLSNAADQPRSMMLLFLDVLPKSFGRTATQLSHSSVFHNVLVCSRPIALAGTPQRPVCASGSAEIIRPPSLTQLRHQGRWWAIDVSEDRLPKIGGP